MLGGRNAAPWAGMALAGGMLLACGSVTDSRTSSSGSGGTGGSSSPGGCATGADCEGAGSRRFCDPTSRRCVECVFETDCADGWQCVDGSCAERRKTPSGAGGDGPEIPGECAPIVMQALEVEIVVSEPEQHTPRAAFLMLDRSAGMARGETPEALGAAIEQFARDEASATLPIGLGTFPFGPGDDAACDGASCAEAVVPIAPLPENASALIDGVAASAPSSNASLAPTECGLRGLLAHCEGYLATHTDHECAGVLVTLAAPNACELSAGALIDLVAGGRADGVRTFVIALSTTETGLFDAIADAGGTGAAFDGSQGAPAIRGALEAIRGQLLSYETSQDPTIQILECSWELPPHPEEAVDPDKVNVQIAPPDADSTPLVLVRDSTWCAAYPEGWYYDLTLGDTGSHVTLCQGACDRARASRDTRVEVLLGCETPIAPPP